MGADVDVSALRRGFGGEVVTSSDPVYDEARAVWNGVIDRRPAVIARCRRIDDVVEALGFALARDLTVAVRGGGHNVAGTGSVDGGLVIDLGSMDEVIVDPDRRIARVGGGAKLGGLDAATQAHGLATSLGVVSETGVAGLTLSGGMGWLRRSHGLSCDNLVGAQVVTADGDLHMAAEDSDVDLLWALRGGGGNFGVVTAFDFALHPVGPDVFFCFVFYPGEIAADVLEACIAYMAGAPDEVSPISFLGRVPAAGAFPTEWHGKPFVAVAGMYVGDPVEGERVLGPLRTLGSPIVDLSGTMPFVEAQKVLDEDYPNGLRYYWKSIELEALGADALATLMSSAAEMSSGASTIDIWFHGGAMSRVAPDATAFGDRSAPILIGVEANWDDPATDQDNIAWARRCIEDLRPFSSGGSYLNFGGFLEDREQLLRAAYGDNYDRLVAVKTEYDPENVFRINQNIPPAPG